MLSRWVHRLKVVVTSVCVLALVGCGSETAIGPEAVDTDSGNDTGNEPIDSPTGTGVDQPNILFVITDDQGLDASALYSLGSDLPDTPVINGLAQRGLVYENVWATPSCTTTRAALLTGKHGVNNGVTFTPGVLSADVGTIQIFLDSTDLTSNYTTAVFGKWHVGGARPDASHPAQLGVDHYAGNLAGNIEDYFDWQVTVNGVSEQNTTYHTTALVDYAIEWIGDQQAPWFTWLAFSAPHSPFHAPPEEFNQRNLSGTDADIRANQRDYYLSAIETLDAELGRLLDALDEKTLDNTIIIVIGDNGTPGNVIDRSVYPTNSHRKGSLFEAGVHVPLVISGAGVERIGEREAGLVSITDFFPTFAVLAGAVVPEGLDGQSIVQSLSAADAIARDYLYTEFESDTPLGSGWTVRSESHKYTAYDDGTEALYDLVVDPGETTNLAQATAESDNIFEPLKSFGLQIRGE